MPHPPPFTLTRAASRKLDHLAVTQFHLPTHLLMENAARFLAAEALRVAAKPNPTILIVCGPGNNGGDGLAAARHLHNAGANVQILLTHPAESLTGDPATHLHIVRKMRIPLGTIAPGNVPVSFSKAITRLGRPHLILDCLFGTGLDRPVTGYLDEVIGRMNAARTGGSLIVSADIPSGLDADSARPLAQLHGAVRAHLTVTFAALKPAFTLPQAREFIGDVSVGDIGVPMELVARLASPVQIQPRPRIEQKGEKPEPRGGLASGTSSGGRERRTRVGRAAAKPGRRPTRR